MTKNFKKFAALGLSVSALACMAVAVGCKQDPETVTYTITVDLPEGATTPSDWMLQYCGTSAGAVCTEVAINAEGVASFTTKDLDEVYDLHVLNAGIYKQVEDVSTVVGTEAYTIEMTVKGSGTEADPYLFEEGVTYTAPWDTENYVGTWYTVDVEEDSTMTFTLGENATVYTNTSGSWGPARYLLATSENSSLDVQAGNTVTFCVYSQDADYNYNASTQWSVAIDNATVTADGSSPYLATEIVANGTPITGVTGAKYYSFTAEEDGVFAIAYSYDFVNVTFGTNCYGQSIYNSNRNYPIAEGETISFYGDYFAAEETLSLTYVTDGSVTADAPGSELYPMEINAATTIEDITLTSGSAYYLNLNGNFEFVVPTGCTASYRDGMMPVSVAAGDKLAITNYNGWSAITVQIANSSDSEVTFDLEIAAYVAPPYTTVADAYQLHEATEGTVITLNSSTTAPVILTYAFDEAGTLTFENLSNVTIYTASIWDGTAYTNEKLTITEGKVVISNYTEGNESLYEWNLYFVLIPNSADTEVAFSYTYEAATTASAE